MAEVMPAALGPALLSNDGWGVVDVGGVPTRNHVLTWQIGESIPATANIPKGATAYLQPNLVPETMGTALIQLGYVIKDLTDQALLQLQATGLEEISPGTLVIADPDRIEAMRRQLSPEAPLILLGISQGIVSAITS